MNKICFHSRISFLIFRSNLLDVGYHPDFILKVKVVNDQKIKVSWPAEKIDEVYLVYLDQFDGPNYHLAGFYSTFNSTSNFPWLEIDCAQEPHDYKILDLSMFKLDGTYDLTFVIRKGHVFTYYTEEIVNLKTLEAKSERIRPGKHASWANFAFPVPAIRITYDRYITKLEGSYEMSQYLPRTRSSITRIVKLGPNRKEIVFEKPVECRTNVSNRKDSCILPDNFTVDFDLNATYLIFYSYSIKIRSEECVQHQISIARIPQKLKRLWEQSRR